LLDKKRYELPEDVVRCNKRVLNNLHYYETNYFLVFILICLFISYLAPGKFFAGLIAVTMSLGSFFYGRSKQPQLKQIYENHPFLFIFINLLTAYLLVYLMNSVSVFILAITTPLLVIFLHASLRVRGKDSVSNQSPMAFFLKWCQILPKE